MNGTLTEISVVEYLESLVANYLSAMSPLRGFLVREHGCLLVVSSLLLCYAWIQRYLKLNPFIQLELQ